MQNPNFNEIQIFANILVYFPPSLNVDPHLFRIEAGKKIKQIVPKGEPYQQRNFPVFFASPGPLYSHLFTSRAALIISNWQKHNSSEKWMELHLQNGLTFAAGVLK